jgi:hypothetical protein
MDALHALLFFIATVLACAVGFNFGRKRSALRLLEVQKKIEHKESFFGDVLRNMRKDGALLPSLTRWAKTLQEEEDKLFVQSMVSKARPALSSATKVQQSRREAREHKALAETLRNQIDLYESLAPWLTEFTELTVDEVVEGIKSQISAESDSGSESEEDPAKRFLSSTEWQSLSREQQLQIALDRYLSPGRKKTLWEVGRDFERYIGYEYENLGFKVSYFGAKNKLNDLGIDLICEDNKEIHIIQCKRLSVLKKIPVRENIVAQIYGASQFYKISKKISSKKKVIPKIITTYILSEQAEEFANHLGVIIQQNKIISSYPVIKCNISKKSREKIFHLPFDQQYDTITIGDVEGEFYASSIDEAVTAGFRHAYRWRGRNDK